ncbi:MAG: hypothetical protein HC862_31390 [Scytonema sp. RU_4_4]|nr:hypothetical protein [Scytonema sp. RU_4_4]
MLIYATLTPDPRRITFCPVTLAIALWGDSFAAARGADRTQFLHKKSCHRTTKTRRSPLHNKLSLGMYKLSLDHNKLSLGMYKLSLDHNKLS